ncbi:MAG: RNA methyltransferase [Zetaproteobacteria bacterium CG06_land_8_20_14_3_00_59_53]|nr:MAG: RNA methyltransferase [Zetaproteobacteria bacterium CG23_combo_of_CG06-09_8_20_14_all_59_86]PIQ64736.1 MAG: RNA methyltransferase [Zetaproteobacteria bacterium CG11_big_fil_rev_8_21_14_0_20_59_439]PIU71370.1 MAG: RNA methyltransferase [Zetaproteobacteria bacterium CG06_land_8_20_14_3_00_59_53]PIU97539.1 MAG: RNA methyltransferase [Zetaproteobacteria bacterium CG03_land_8_20_14_0_80_59_51]PIY46303.1 MAG: RNA methyltransferase [Zetaproteobacteria bacterium CG_4_10_14_0_8_um_filter_59_127]
MEINEIEHHAQAEHTAADGLACFAVVVPGLEKIAAAELNTLAVHAVQVVEGGVNFTGSMDALCRINLRARSITRVLVRLAGFKALSFPELFNKAQKPAWERYISAGRAVTVKASCHSSKLMHSGRVEQAVLDGIAEKLNKADISLGDSGDAQLITVRLEHDQCVISIDSSGERLDRRGYRLLTGLAPIRETVAAAMLQWMDWKPEEPLLVPMCGSGTFAIEAALIGQGRAANLAHDFALLHWPALHQKRWKRVQDKAAGMQRDLSLNILASDSDEAVLGQAVSNAAQAGVADVIRFDRQDVRALQPPKGSQGGVIVCNPPYGDRIRGDATVLYRDIGKLLKQDAFKGWRMAIIVPDPECEKALGLAAKRRMKIKHGGKWVRVLHLRRV